MKINIKNRPDYLFNDNMIVSIKDFDSSLLEINKLSFKGDFSLNIYYVKYIPTGSTNRVSIDRADDDEDYLYLFPDDVDGYIEENDGIKYLVFASTKKDKEAFKNYTKLCEETKREIKVINDDEPIKYRKDFMKIKFELDDDLAWVKHLFLKKMVNVIHIFFYMNARMTYKNAAMRFQMELTLIKQVHQKNVYFVIIGTLKMLDLNLNHMFVINVLMF